MLYKFYNLNSQCQTGYDIMGASEVKGKLLKLLF